MNAATNEFVVQSRSGPNGNATNYFLKLGVGATIGSTRTFATSGIFNNFYAGGGAFGPTGAHNGDWTAGNRGFVGLEITVNGVVDYGFADITVNNYSGTFNGATNTTYTLSGYAFDNTGAAITTFAIPEPGSTTALLLAGGTAGAAALRRRRRSAA